jgi:hypothetical protein
MKRVIALSALLSLAPAIAFAQDASTTGRGAGARSVGPASENGDNTLGNTRNPIATGRSVYTGGAPSVTPATNGSPPIQVPSGPRE